MPEQHKSSDFGKATVQYFDTFAHQNQRPQFALSQSQIGPQWVAQHALGLGRQYRHSKTLSVISTRNIQKRFLSRQTEIVRFSALRNHSLKEQPSPIGGHINA